VLVITAERVATEVPSVSLQKAQPDPSDAPKGTARPAVARPSTCYETVEIHECKEINLLDQNGDGMKKKIVLLTALGAAGGLLYALESQHKRKQTASASNEADKEVASRNGRSADASQAGGRQSEPAASMARIENEEASTGNASEHLLDDLGTDQSEASQILKRIRDGAFEANDEKLALALGRPTEEIEEWTRGDGLIDGDVILKARTLAMQRGFEI